MTTELEEEVQFADYLDPATGFLKLKPRTPMKTLMALGAQIVMTADQHKWHRGDILNHMLKYHGDDHAALVDPDDVEKDRKLMWVCSRIPASRRRSADGVLFGFHDVVAALEPQEQDELLEMAFRKKLPRDTLRQVRNERHPELTRKKPSALQPPTIEHAPDPGIGLVKAGGIGRRPEDEPARAPAHEAILVEPAHKNGNGHDVLPPEREVRDTDSALHELRMLRDMTQAPALKRALIIVLDDYERLVQIAITAARAVQVGSITPELEAMVVH